MKRRLHLGESRVGHSRQTANEVLSGGVDWLAIVSRVGCTVRRVRVGGGLAGCSLVSAGGLVIDARQLLGENLSGALVLLCGRVSLRSVGLCLRGQCRRGPRDDENLFKLREVGRGLNSYGRIGLVLRVGHDRLDDADGKTAWEDLITARSHHLLAGLDALVRREVVDLDLACGRSTENAADTGGLEQNAGARARVVNEQKLRGMREDV